jgi:hypothetical protein
MADNVTANPGSGGPVFATDDIGGVNYPRSKVVFGADGSATDVSVVDPLPTQEVSGAMSILARILQVLMSPMGFDRSLSRQRVTGIIESGTVTVGSITAGTVTTVSTVSAITDFSAGGLQGRHLVWGANQSAWADTHRARIT